MNLGPEFSLFETLPRAETLGVLNDPMPRNVDALLLGRGIKKLYCHQSEAVDAFRRGEDIVVSTGTNSGKSLCYQIPLLIKAEEEPFARSLMIIPTKALAQDQAERLEKLGESIGLRVATYDGDTPKSRRSSIRQVANVIISNPDMIHAGMLPGHELWVKFLRSLRLIVLDEVHVYRGVFGSHVAHILRRLLRLAEWHGNRPQIIACSGTIPNAAEHFEALTGRKPHLIDRDGSPQGRRVYAVLNAGAFQNNEDLTPNQVTGRLLADLSMEHRHTIAFNRSRVSTEAVLKHAHQRLEDNDDEPVIVESYRGGYTATERRTIEKRLHKGIVRGVSATDALELGIDVGSLDTVILNGYPGSVASARQRAGRAGRGLTESLVIYIPHDDPLEQFMAREPDRLWNGPAEPARIDLHNPYIERSHLLCAASERALSPSELEAYSSTALTCAEGLERAGELRFQAGRFFYPSHESPASNVQIRGTSGDEFRLTVNGEVIGTMEYWRALMECFPGGVYLHRGRSYVVEHLNLPGRMVELRMQDVGYGTQSHVQSTIRPLVEYFREGDFTMHRVEVTHLVTGYKVTGFRRGVEESHHELELPPYKIETSALRIEVPDLVPDDDGIAALHAVEHALLVIAPLLAGCDRQDLGSTWYLLEPTVLRPAIYLFDSVPGGIGLCEQLVHDRVRWLDTALELLRSCDCEGGCPNCLLLTRCPYGNDSLSKSGGIQLLESIRARLG